LPLVFFNAIQQDELLTFLYAPPPVPAPPVPPQPSRALMHGATKTQFKLDDIQYAPDTIPKGISQAPDEAVDFPGIERTITGIGVSDPRPVAREAITGLMAEPPGPLPRLEPPRRPDRIIVGGRLQESKCIYRPDPIYPELARRAHISGTVLLEAVIDEEGSIAEIKVLSGHPLLREAAVQAVKRWKYSPTVLNGEPYQVLATVTVEFRLH
jgi:periplasmic protein TonB